jgi:N-acetylglutamate synthase-like GNAT family acetyltransferase
MSKLNKRIKTYGLISTRLSGLSNEQLSDLLAKSEHISHFGITGKSFLLEIDDFKIFVKKIPLTDLERRPENFMSTANIFDMPFSSHIGVGGAGISSWRELLVQIMTTNWVISGECENFPLMYHWRMLPSNKPEPMTTEELADLDKKVKYWDNSPAERARLEEMRNASTHIYLFLEYIPETLFKWLNAKLLVGGSVAEEAISLIDEQLKETNKFMNSHGLLHFDVHFWNILADDDTMYLTDFGLSLYTKFDLSTDEKRLFDKYRTYDQCVSVTNFLLCIIGCIFGKDPWEIKIVDYIGDKLEELEPPIASFIKRYSEIAIIITKFFQDMQKMSKSTPYPEKQLEHLLAKNENIKHEKPFCICHATDDDIDYIQSKIIEFNRSKVAFTQDEEPIYQNYIIKNNDKIIAGINAMIYHWGILYVDVLFVDENHRNKNLGSKLLQKVENEARVMGASIVHLDTFDFQAKDFYIKHGYTIFGVMEDCPTGHNRYYFSKRL